MVVFFCFCLKGERNEPVPLNLPNISRVVVPVSPAAVMRKNGRKTVGGLKIIDNNVAADQRPESRRGDDTTPF